VNERRLPEATGWFSVRCVFRFPDGCGGTYEERITLWRATDFADAVTLAEAEAESYAATFVGAEYVGLAQAYALDDEPVHGAEIFSLMRDSDLAPDGYLNTFFDTGDERQGAIDAE
jgi:hypothetical protein